MKQHEVTVPQIGLIAGTRAMLGAGIALLLSDKLSGEQRRAIGWTLVAVGALTTIPLVLQLFCDEEWSRRRVPARARMRNWRPFSTAAADMSGEYEWSRLVLWRRDSDCSLKSVGRVEAGLRHWFTNLVTKIEDFWELRSANSGELNVVRETITKRNTAVVRAFRRWIT